jgi:hypothetical protein
MPSCCAASHYHATRRKDGGAVLSQIRFPPFRIRGQGVLLPTGECRTGADLEAIPHRQPLPQIWLALSYVDAATAGLTRGGPDVEPLHHAHILMVGDMAMRDKTAHGDRIEIHPKRDRSRYCIIDVVWWSKTGIRRVGGA